MSTSILHRLGHGVAAERPVTEDELKLILAESHRGGVVSDGEAEIIVRAFEFADKQAEEIMIPAKPKQTVVRARVLKNLQAVVK